MENILKNVSRLSFCLMLFIYSDSFGSSYMRRLPFFKQRALLQQKPTSEKYVQYASLLRERRKANDLIIILDPHDVETVTGPNNAKNAQSITNTLMQAIQEKAAPIVTSTSLMNNICFFYTYETSSILIQALKKIREQAGLDLPLFSVESKNDNILLFPNWVSPLDFSQDDWYCYIHKNADLMILIPKEYLIKKQFNEESDTSIILPLCGFEKKFFEEVPATFNDISSYLNSWKRRWLLWKFQFIEALTGIFMRQNSNPWNIYLLGHGNAPLANNPQSGSISGLSLSDFKTLLTFFNDKMKVSFFFYTSCFAGGINQIYVNKILSDLKVNFIVGTSGINETSEKMFSATELTAFERSKITPKNFSHFFNLLHKYFGMISTPFITPEQEKSFLSDPLETIVYTITNKDSLAYIRIPDTGIFEAKTIDETVKIITPIIAQNPRMLDFGHNTISKIVVYASYIPYPIIIKSSMPSIISPAPQTIDQNKHSIHIFTNVKWKLPLEQILASFIRSNSSSTRITFVVKELETYTKNRRPITYKNLIIDLKGIISSQTRHIDTTFTILYESNNETEDPQYRPYLIHGTIADLQDAKNIHTYFSSEKRKLIVNKDIRETAIQLLNITPKPILQNLSDVIKVYDRFNPQFNPAPLTTEQLRQRLIKE